MAGEEEGGWLWLSTPCGTIAPLLGIRITPQHFVLGRYSVDCILSTLFSLSRVGTFILATERSPLCCSLYFPIFPEYFPIDFICYQKWLAATKSMIIYLKVSCVDACIAAMSPAPPSNRAPAAAPWQLF